MHWRRIIGFNNSILVPERYQWLSQGGQWKKIDIGAYEYIKSFPVPMHEENKPGSSTQCFLIRQNYATIMSKDDLNHDVFFYLISPEVDPAI